MDAATSWRTRVTWAIVGAAVTLAIVSWRDREGASKPSMDVGDGSSPKAPPVSTPLVQPTMAPIEAAHVDEAISLVPPPIDATDDPVELGVTTEPSTDVGPAIASPAPVPTAAAPAAPFELPLPLMPGARIMKRSQRPDAEHGGVIVTLALSVPAPGMQVESFYRAALTNAKLTVSGGSTQPSTMGTGHRSSLRGRSRNARVNVNLRQPAGKLRTIVRIIWQTLP